MAISWQKCGDEEIPYRNLPMDGSEFLVMHPNWFTPAVVCYDSFISQFIFADDKLWHDPNKEMIVDEFDDLIFCEIPDFPKWWWEELDAREG